MKTRIKNNLIYLVVFALLVSCISVSTTTLNAKAASKVIVSYRTHVQNIGWQPYVSDGDMSGTSGKGLRLEGINIKISGNSDLGIQYTTHVQTYGWLPWSSNNEMSGTEGESKRLEAIKIQLTGKDKNKYDVYYRVHTQSYGWLGWAKNGQAAGTAGLSKRLEGIQIVIVNKNETVENNFKGIESKDSRPYIDSKGASDITVAEDDNNIIIYQTHVQTYGWQAWKKNGELSGTSGESKRLEGIKIRLSNKTYSGNVEYCTHVQSIGWQPYVSNGKMAGTSGMGLRLEGIKIKLTGEIANYYDIMYRTHIQSIGWQDWKKNDEMAGTSGKGLRLEGIEIKLVKKNTTPTNPSEPTTEEPTVHTHQYTSKVTTKATCTTDGVKTYTCSCGKTYTETIKATGHKYTSKVTKEPTYTSEGERMYTCSKCGDTYKERIAKLVKDPVTEDPTTTETTEHVHNWVINDPIETTLDRGVGLHICWWTSRTNNRTHYNGNGYDHYDMKIVENHIHECADCGTSSAYNAYLTVREARYQITTYKTCSCGAKEIIEQQEITCQPEKYIDLTGTTLANYVETHPQYKDLDALNLLYTYITDNNLWQEIFQRKLSIEEFKAFLDQFCGDGIE